MTPEKLRMVADWLDTYDRMAQAFVDICEAAGVGEPGVLAKCKDTVGGKEVQDELRRWADEMEAA